MKHLRLFEDHSTDSATLQKIEADFPTFMRGLGLDSDSSSVSGEIRDLGNWEHDEADSYDREEDDEDWREDDDQMIWAPGEYRKYFEQFKKWAQDKSWRDKVELSIETGEKNWVTFIVRLKK